MNKNCSLLTFLIILRYVLPGYANEIACDKEDCFVDQCCSLLETAIDSSNFQFSGHEDESVRLFDSSRNRKMEFLPIKIGNKFPNLVTIAAERCAIKEITKIIFENLFHLRVLNLNGNRIESIKVDTFKDLVSLETLLLVRNNIKAMESELFSSLRNLKLVNFLSNNCINESFSDVEVLSKAVDENCKKTESVKVQPKCEVIEKCSIGEKCCRLSQFENSDLEIKRLALQTELNWGVNVDAISYNNNPKVEYLLIGLDLVFKNLKTYDASNCSVREIFWGNFDGFESLESIDLANNQISTLNEKLFDGMQLKKLDLSHNHIKFLTTGQFESLLPSLEIVDLISNVCIDEIFSGETEIRGMIATVRRSCNFELQKSNPKEVWCEQNLRSEYGICCFIGTDTNISSQGYEITSTDFKRVQSLTIEDYKRENSLDNVRYLPVVNRFIRNLIEYRVVDAAISVIGKENFEGMIWLERLTLQETLIETIPNDIFHGLVRLKDVDLADNKIVSIKGSVFDQLPTLQYVNLDSNKCIDQIFRSEDIPGLSKTVNRTCGFEKNETKIACEIISSFVCEMKTYTTIKDIAYTISGPFNDKVSRIDLCDNRNIEFLPISVHKTFPSVNTYHAARCSIKEISKRNFENLDLLEELNLQENQIYAVMSDTFEGLSNLTELDLSKNKIKFMNGQAFKDFSYAQLDLSGNECFDSGYSDTNDSESSDSSEIDFLVEISKKCGFTERSAGKQQISCLKDNCGDDEDEICCRFDNFLAINSSDFKLSDRRHDDVVDINMNQNPKIEFLPISVFLKFSNVRTYKAHRCSIREVSKSNFEYLLKLQKINLSFNRIETIKHNTFEGLLDLKRVLLNNNPIKSMNGRVFEGLRVLNFVNLTKGGCIDKAFDGYEQILELSNAVTELCGFAEVGSADFKKLYSNCSAIPSAKGYIMGGKPSERGQWPFLAAILLKEPRKFFCGGSLITDRHVLTAAHCVHEKYADKLSASDILVLLGHHNLSSLSEAHSKSLNVESIFVHGSWSATDSKYDADLALLALAKTVEFSPFIQPVCVTDDSKIMKLEDGYVVGWGKGDSDAIHEDTPKQALIRAVNDSYCFQSDPALGEIYSHRTFCAKGQGAGPCRGDSGGGFFIKFGGLWTLRGTVSAGPVDLFGECEINRFTLYTKLTYYFDWMKRKIKLRKYMEVSSFN